MTQSAHAKKKIIEAKKNNSKPKYDLFKKNIFTKNKWEKVDRFDSPVMANEEANFIKSQRFIQSKGKPEVKTQTKIVKVA